MKNKYSLLLLVIVGAALVAASCAPAPTPPVPTPVPPTQAPQPTGAPTVAPSAVPTTAPTSAASPTKATVVGPPTLAPTKATPTLIANTPKSFEEVQRVSPEWLKAMIEGGADIVVADNQPAEIYAMMRVKGAVSLPWDMKLKSAGGLPKDKLVVLYCACAHEEDAGDVAMQLITNFGYKKIVLLEGGWNRWVELGYPTEKGGK